MSLKIALLNGDGVGPELIESSKKLIEHIGSIYSLDFTFEYGDVGESTNSNLSDSTLKLCKSSDAILLGTLSRASSQILPQIVKKLNLYSIVKEYKVFENIKSNINIKNTNYNSLDITLVSDTLSGVAKNEFSYTSIESGRAAYDKITYSELEIEKVARTAYEIAEQKNNSLFLADDAASMLTSRLWRKIVTDINEDYPDVKVDTLTVGETINAIIKNPENISVILTSNIYSRIISDTLISIMGLKENIPVSFIGDNLLSLYLTTLDSNDMFKGLNIVNPIGMIISIANMFTLSFGRYDIEKRIMDAIDKTLKLKLPYELGGEGKTSEIVESIIKNI